MPTTRKPITLAVQLDLDAHLAGQPVYGADGEIIGSGPTTVEDLVLDLAAQRLADRAVAAATDDPYRPLRQRVAEIRDEQIRGAVAPMVTEVLDAAIQPTNNLGEASCAPTTLRTIVRDQAVQWLTTGTRDRYSNPKGLTRVEAMIAEAVDRALSKEIADAIAEAKAEVVTAVRAQAAQVLAGTIAAAAADPKVAG